MITTILFSTLWRRFITATVLWVAFWPVLWFFRLGEITGPKAWFWIVGELNYPFALMVYLLVDNVMARVGLKGVQIFLVCCLAVVLFMLVFYSRGGFSFGVLAEAFLF